MAAPRPHRCAANQATGSVSVFMRQPPDPKNPSVSFSDALNLTVGDDPVDLVTGDLDGDGRTDITTVNRLRNSVSVLLNRTTVTGEASFAPAVTLPTGGEPQSVVLGDFDQDTATGEPADLDLALTARATTEPERPARDQGAPQRPRQRRAGAGARRRHRGARRPEADRGRRVRSRGGR